MRGKFKLWILISGMITANVWLLSSQTDSSVASVSDNKTFGIFKISTWPEPKKASILSALLPGAGQVYNKRYWKVPIIYGAGGLLAYNVVWQNNRYLYYKRELLSVLNGAVSKDGLSAQQISLLKNQSKKWRDLSIAGVALVYVLNILDAHVDAHLKRFDISDDLSLFIRPDFFPITGQSYSPSIQYGLKICVIRR
ncbi:MAG: hypothetical protein KatS3mg028_0629 [Bacteroidia bacterium]|nr:MAG: hypothetical protein KatS3mg028_0629 [Bacteroidia bacterium]